MIAVEGDAEAASYFKQFDEKKETIKSKARSIIIYDGNAKEKTIRWKLKIKKKSRCIKKCKNTVTTALFLTFSLLLISLLPEGVFVWNTVSEGT